MALKNTEENRTKIFRAVEVLLVGTVLCIAASVVIDSWIPCVISGILAAITVGLAAEYNHLDKFK